MRNSPFQLSGQGDLKFGVAEDAVDVAVGHRRRPDARSWGHGGGLRGGRRRARGAHRSEDGAWGVRVDRGSAATIPAGDPPRPEDLAPQRLPRVRTPSREPGQPPLVLSMELLERDTRSRTSAQGRFSSRAGRERAGHADRLRAGGGAPGGSPPPRPQAKQRHAGTGAWWERTGRGHGFRHRAGDGRAAGGDDLGRSDRLLETDRPGGTRGVLVSRAPARADEELPVRQLGCGRAIRIACSPATEWWTSSGSSGRTWRRRSTSLPAGRSPSAPGPGRCSQAPCAAWGS